MEKKRYDLWRQSKTALLPANLKITIEGKMVVMKPISHNEINSRYISWLNDPQVTEFLDAGFMRHSKRDVLNYINALRKKEGCELFAIFSKNKSVHIGNVSIIDYNPNNQGYATYGIIIGDPEARLLGLGAEVSVLIIEYLFSNRAIRRIKEAAFSDNQKSCKTFEALGFKREGVLREHVVLNSGKINDLYIYGMLREEWRKNYDRVKNILKFVKIREKK